MRSIQKAQLVKQHSKILLAVNLLDLNTNVQIFEHQEEVEAGLAITVEEEFYEAVKEGKKK